MRAPSDSLSRALFSALVIFSGVEYAYAVEAVKSENAAGTGETATANRVALLSASGLQQRDKAEGGSL